MKRKIKYVNEPMPVVYEVINDFLPPPEQLAMKEESVKVTLSLSKQSMEFLKNAASKNHSHYQTMIRKLVDYYVAHYKNA